MAVRKRYTTVPFMRTTAAFSQILSHCTKKGEFKVPLIVRLDRRQLTFKENIWLYNRSKTSETFFLFNEIYSGLVYESVHLIYFKLWSELNNPRTVFWTGDSLQIVMLFTYKVREDILT